MIAGIALPAWSSPPFRVVAIGNSITVHAPASAIGWHGNWGMAASTEQRDYVSRLGELLRNLHGAEVQLSRMPFGAWERDPDSAHLDAAQREQMRNSQLLIVELGDNVKPANAQAFGRALATMLAAARPSNGQVLCLTTWWHSSIVDGQIKAACEASGASVVPIGDIHDTMDPPGAARRPGQTDKGVLMHPSDVGMAEIAARLFARWRQRQSGSPDQAPPRPPAHQGRQP